MGYLLRMSKSPIAQARQRAGLTQAKLAEICGVTVVSVKRWEAGTRSPGGAHLILLEHKLGISAGEALAFREGRKSQSPGRKSPRPQAPSAA